MPFACFLHARTRFDVLSPLDCREITPSDGHPVLSVSWSPTGDAFLCVTGSAQPRFYDRDGKLLGECARGDMYIRDMKNTKGHITGCSGGCWHPIDRYTAVTSSEDGTVRWVEPACAPLGPLPA
jgi:WD40 repeat protein